MKSGMSHDKHHGKHHSRHHDKSEFTEEQQHKLDDPDYIRYRKRLSSNLVIHTVLRPLTFFIFMFSFYLLWNGHNAPGGGFIAGLMTAAGIVLLYVNYGSGFILRNLPFDFKYLVAIGLWCSMSCGLGALIFGYPYLTQTFGHMYFPFLGEIEIASALIFDIGVYMVVTGGCLAIITGIGQSDIKAAKLSEPALQQEKDR